MKKIILILVIVGVAGVVIFSFLKFYKSGNFVLSKPLTDNLASDGDNSVVTEEIIPPEIKKVDEMSNTYIHKKYGFTFNYPSDMKTSNFREGDGEQIIFQNDRTGNWFQIYIMPWDEGEDITVERIKEDLPELPILESQRVVLGSRQKEGIGPNAIIFFSKDSNLGETREVWFVAHNNLYQITTYKRLDTMIGKILSTFSFGE